MSAYHFYVRGPNSSKLKEYDHDGATYIEGRKGSEYTLFFYNNTNYPVEAVFSVDGLSIVDGKPAGVQSTGYVVQAYGSVEVPGWRIDGSKVAKFVFQPQGDTRDLTYVEALKADGIQVDAGNQGVIGCLVFTEYFDGRKMYRDSMLMNATSKGGFRSFGASGQSLGSERGVPCSATLGSSRRIETETYTKGAVPLPQNAATMDWMPTSDLSEPEKGLGTGFGDDKTYQTRKVTFKRANPFTPVYTRVITYDTLKGLRKRGVPVDPAPNSISNAFPASPELSRDGCRIPTRRG